MTNSPTTDITSTTSATGPWPTVHGLPADLRGDDRVVQLAAQVDTCTRAVETARAGTVAERDRHAATRAQLVELGRAAIDTEKGLNAELNLLRGRNAELEKKAAAPGVDWSDRLVAIGFMTVLGVMLICCAVAQIAQSTGRC